jgi:hypothetical protein
MNLPCMMQLSCAWHVMIIANACSGGCSAVQWPPAIEQSQAAVQCIYVGMAIGCASIPAAVAWDVAARALPGFDMMTPLHEFASRQR